MLGNTSWRWRFCLPPLFATAVIGCGGGGGGGSGGAPPAATANSTTQQQTTFRVRGSVGDGPVAGADLVFTDKNDRVIATATSGEQATYSVDLPQNSEAPLRISAIGGMDMVTGRPLEFELLSLVGTAAAGTANVSPVTTVLTQSFGCAAEASTERSIDDIWVSTQDELALGLQQAQFVDPITQSVSPQSAAAFVLVNEALGEVIRRSARVIGEEQERSEFEVANELIKAFGCDLTDGVFDGQSDTGPLPNSDKTLLGVARVMDTLVRLELLTGKLTVDGADATLKLNAAIETIQPQSTVGVQDVLLSDNAAAVVLESLSVLQSLDPSGELAEFAATLDGVSTELAMARASQALEAGLGERIRTLGSEVLTLGTAQIERVVSLQPLQAETISARTDPEVAPASPIDQPVPAPDETAADQPISTGSSSDQQTAVPTTNTTPPATAQAAANASAETPADNTLAHASADITSVQASADTASDEAPADTASVEAPADTASDEAPADTASVETPGTTGTGAESQKSAPETKSSPTEEAVPVPQPTVQIVAENPKVNAGSYVELNWTTTDATQCRATGAWNGSKTTSGSELVGPVDQPSTYTLSCDGPGGTAVTMTEISAIGTVELSWQAPEKNTDGTTVKGLSRFKVYYGSESRQYTEPLEVQGNKRKHTVELPVGVYYFAVSAIDLEGDESALSNEIVESVN